MLAVLLENTRHIRRLASGVRLTELVLVTSLQRKILERLAEVKEGATMCPGQLSRDCGTTLSSAREDILELAKAKKIKISQGGKPANLTAIKGPFRVRPA